MEHPDFETFKADAKARGFDIVVRRVWLPDQVVEEHVHEFEADALVVAGEMWLTVGGVCRHLVPGGTFVIPAFTRHEERYGPEGATYWVARR